ncbi:MAG TPA: CocE/NonD family hydrolase [Bacteroidales bacterium]|nr:CocE/NonD family hydrolase [Bacteroidales bacterium]
MDKFKILLTFFYILSSLAASSQIQLNGTIDSFDELCRIETHATKMDDSTILMMDFYMPVTQDCVVTVVFIPGMGNIPIQIIPRNTQYLIYDSTDNHLNPNPYQLPLVFTRTPYNKNGDDLGPVMAFLGYVYGAQDMRGAYSSSGVYFPMYSDSWKKNDYIPNIHYNVDITDHGDAQNANRHEDGYQTLQRLLNNTKRIYDFNGDMQQDTFLISNGSIGMIGASALGNSQYTLAAVHPVNSSQPGLQSIMPLVSSADHYLYTLTNNGVYRQALVDNWISGQFNSLINDSLNGIDNSIMNNLHSSTDYGCSNKAEIATKSIDFLLDEGTIPGYYPDSPLRACMDVSYAPVDVNGNADSNGTYSRYRNMDVPAYHVSGWWDIFVDGQIYSFNKMREESLDQDTRKLQKLIIGPWAHQTVGSLTTGDVTYYSNADDVLGFDISNFTFSMSNSNILNDIMKSEIFNWFRYTLNKNGVPATSLPKFIIPESHAWQNIGVDLDIRVPSENYIIPYTSFIQYLAGQTTLDNVKIEIKTATDTTPYTYSFPALNPPILPISDTITSTSVTDFMHVPAVRLYMVGPVNDGVPENSSCGNYWISCDSFPIHNGIHNISFYLHADSSINTQPPSANEGYLTYLHDPDHPVLTVGGANMTIQTPQGPPRKSQGQMNLANPLFINYTMDNPGVLKFTGGLIQDSLCILGFPTATIYAKSDVSGNNLTDADFFIRILDVYPDGREFFVVEGCVNARAREYVRSLYIDNENINVPYSNINSGTIYEYQLKMMPIGYVWGKNHRIKILISSGNYPRYQSNPDLPIMDHDFFRRKPGDGKKYNYAGNLMSPRIAVQSIYFSTVYPSHIVLPVLDYIPSGIDENNKLTQDYSWSVYPNPCSEYAFINLPDEDGLVQIFSASGQLLEKRNTDRSVVWDVSKYTPGIYIIKYHSENQAFSRKIIVTR